MKRFLSLFIHNERGAAGAEMALMLPLLMTLMFGSFELGHYFWTQHTLTKAVRDGARFASRQPFALFNCAAGTISGAALAQYSDLTLTEAVQNVTVYGQPAEGTAKVKDWDIAEVSVEVSCAAAAVDGSGDTNVETGLYQNVGNAPIVTVSAVDVPYPSLFETLGLIDSDVEMNASQQSAVMGF